MKPTQSWKHKGINIAEWRNERGVNYTIRKTYLKKDTGEWLEAKSWFREELKELHRLLGEAIATFGESEAMPELQFTTEASNAAIVAGIGNARGKLLNDVAANLAKLGSPTTVAFNDDEIPF